MYKNAILKVVKTKVVFSFFVFLFFLLSGRALAVSPEVTAVSPDTKIQGWYGVLTLTGSNFVSGISVETSGADILVYQNTITLESSTTLEVSILVSSLEALGTKDITVTNPSGEASTAGNIFTVVAAGTEPAFSNIYIDGSPYTYEATASSIVAFDVSPGNWVSGEPEVSFEVTSYATALADVKIYYDGELVGTIQGSSVDSFFSFALNAYAVTRVTPFRWIVDQLIDPSTASSPGSHALNLVATDNWGNDGSQLLTVGVRSTPAQQGKTGTAREPMNKAPAYVVPVNGKSYIDPEREEGLQLQIRPDEDTFIPAEGVDVIATQNGKILGKQSYLGFIDDYKTVSIKLKNAGLGVGVVLIIDRASGKVLSRNKVMFYK